MATLTSADWIPKYQKFWESDDIIQEVANSSYSDNILLTALSDRGAAWTIPMLAQYLADRQNATIPALVGVLLSGDGVPIVTPTIRYDAPAGLGTDGVGIWFSTPNIGIEIVRWYVNGTQKVERPQDLATNRSATLAELDASPSDNIQVCIVAGGVVGWWGSI